MCSFDLVEIEELVAARAGLIHDRAEVAVAIDEIDIRIFDANIHRRIRHHTGGVTFHIDELVRDFLLLGAEVLDIKCSAE
jgi:hypothetical protein